MKMTITNKLDHLKKSKFGEWESKRGIPARHSFTIFTKDNQCRRGEYAEEIDVLADTVGAAKKIAQAVLDAQYIDELRISRVDMNY